MVFNTRIVWNCCLETLWSVFSVQRAHRSRSREDKIALNVDIIFSDQKPLHSRKGQWTNQKYQNLVGCDQQMQRLEETELRKADRTVGINCYIFIYIQYFDEGLSRSFVGGFGKIFEFFCTETLPAQK